MDLIRLHQGFDTLQLLTMPLSIAVLLPYWVSHWIKLLSLPGAEYYYPDSVYKVRIDHKHSKFHLMLLLDIQRRDPHALWRARPGVPYDGILCFMGLYQRTSPPLPPSSLLMFYSRDGTEH